MNIAVFADVHGRIALAFKLCAHWQKEMGEKIDLILQAGDLGAYPVLERLDKATISHAEADPTELGFMQSFYQYDEQVAEMLEETTCNMIFVRGNHEDHEWLDELEQQHEGPLFPVDVYRRIFCLTTGRPYAFTSGEETVHILGIGRIGMPDNKKGMKAKHIQDYELERIYDLKKTCCGCALDA